MPETWDQQQHHGKTQRGGCKQDSHPVGEPTHKPIHTTAGRTHRRLTELVEPSQAVAMAHKDDQACKSGTRHSHEENMVQTSRRPPRVTGDSTHGRPMPTTGAMQAAAQGHTQQKVETSSSALTSSPQAKRLGPRQRKDRDRRHMPRQQTAPTGPRSARSARMRLISS